jgi:APA family basic amino acid/polyamine antiporter
MGSHSSEGGTGSSLELPRVLGLWDIVGIVVGGVIGSGIFIVPAAIAAEIRSPFLMLAVWLLGGLLSLFGALSLSELGAAFPQAGGMYVYLREAYGSLVAFLFGWALFLIIDTGAIATLAVAFSSLYLPHFVDLPPVASRGIAAGAVLFLVVVNYIGVRWGANLQNAFALLKFAALFGVCSIVFLFAEGDRTHYTEPALPLFNWNLLESLGIAVVATLWAYKGWESPTYSAGETKNPGRNIPMGILLGISSVILLYLLANLAYLYVLPTDEIARSDRIASEAMNAAVGPMGASIIAFIILLSIMGAANQVVLTSPRVYFAMARDGLFFKRVAEVHPKYLTPHVSIVAMGVWATILSLTGTFEELFTYVIFGQWIFFGLTVAAVIILRKKRPDLPRPYRTLGYPLTPILFLLGALFLSLNTLINEFLSSLAGLVIIFLGLPAYLYWRKKLIGD